MIELRDSTEDDLEPMFRWRREPEVDRWMYGLPPENFEAHRRWFEAFRADPDRTGWIIVSKGEACGLLTLSGLASPQKRAQWGWYIGEAKARGHGAGRAAQA